MIVDLPFAGRLRVATTESNRPVEESRFGGCVLVQVELLTPVSPVHKCLIIVVVIARHTINHNIKIGEF